MKVSQGNRLQAIRFEKYCIEYLGCTDKALHNLYLFHLAEGNEQELLDYLNSPYAK